MRLFFDARYIRTDFHDGISRFSTELAHAVEEEAAVRGIDVTYLICDPAQRSHLPDGAQARRMHAPTSWKEPFSALLLNRRTPDVVFSPMQTIGSFGRRFHLILTLHDTIYYRHRTPPHDLPWPIRLGWRLFHLSPIPQRITLNAADIVATVSETSKRQFAKMRLTKRPIIVVPNAPRNLSALLPEGEAVRAEKSRNLIYMGSFMPYKNVETLVRAMRSLPGRTLHLLSRISPERRRDLTAVAPAGAEVVHEGMSDGEYAAARAPESSIVFHDGVTDAEYAALLADDAVLVTASLDEGYGLPIAEALAMGVPAVVSDAEIFHEVAGGGALYAPARDADGFARAIKTLADPAVRARVVDVGRAHIRGYSWQRSAEVLLDAVAQLGRR